MNTYYCVVELVDNDLYSDAVMMDAEHCPTMETTLKEIKENWVW